jgi:hypothetical protein
VKEFFRCWQDFTAQKARLVESRRQRVMIDFREFWFQNALSDPFYSYFQQPSDYAQKQQTQHQLAYRLHKRLVRTGREQPKDTMNHQTRPSFLPMLFNLPKQYLDRQSSLHRRYQQVENKSESDHIPLSTLLTRQDDPLPLIRERLGLSKVNGTMTHRREDEFAIKQRLLESSLIEQGTLKDVDALIQSYYASSSDKVVHLPMIEQRRSSHRTVKTSD